MQKQSNMQNSGMTIFFSIIFNLESLFFYSFIVYIQQ